MDKEVIIWTEGGEGLGMGHVVRSLNIASQLRKTGLKPSFIINPDETTQKRVMMEGFTFITNTFDANFKGSSLDLLSGTGVVVIDTKRDVSEIVQSLSTKGIKVMLVDNTTPASEYADMVIIPSLIPPAFEEPSNIESNRVFSGSDYLILGDNFLKVHKEHSSGSYALPLRVLVTFGGADPNDLTSMVVDALCNIKDLDVTVVIGPAFAKRDPYAFSSDCPHVHCVSGLRDLAPLMKKAHVAFTANGTTIYELAFMGVPSLLIANFEADLKELEAYEDLGISKGLGLFSDLTPETIQRSLAGFSSKGFLETSSKKARILTDGLGATRVAALVASLLDENTKTETKAPL